MGNKFKIGDKVAVYNGTDRMVGYIDGDTQIVGCYWFKDIKHGHRLIVHAKQLRCFSQKFKIGEKVLFDYQGKEYIGYIKEIFKNNKNIELSIPNATIIGQKDEVRKFKNKKIKAINTELPYKEYQNNLAVDIIPFDYDKFNTGNYIAVNRTGKIVKLIKPNDSQPKDSPIFLHIEYDINYWSNNYINGRFYNTEDSINDIFLLKIKSDLKRRD